VQLIRAETDTHLWAQTYTKTVGNLMALHGDVALAIAAEIGARLPPQDARRITGARAVDPEAYRLFVEGQRLRHRATEPELYAALDLFEQAIRIDPSYARAYCATAETWIALAGFAAYLPPLEGFPKAKAAALKALAIDDSLAEAHTSLGFIAEAFEWDFVSAEAYYQRALALSPNDAEAHKRYGLHLVRTGRQKQGLQATQRAFELNPLSLDNNVSLGMRLIAAGRQQEGIAAMLDAAKLEPTHFEPWVHLGEAYVRMGRADEAIAAARKAVDLSHGGAHAVHMLAHITGQLGRRAEAEALLEPLEALTSHRNAYDIAMFHLALGNADKALRWFSTACEERTPQMAFFQNAQRGRQFDAVRNDARFTGILGCVRAGGGKAAN
jgi:tetratricopeptide (TPR) repeat protein